MKKRPEPHERTLWRVASHELPAILLLNAFIALASTLLYKDWDHWWSTFASSNCIGLSTYATAVTLNRWKLYCFDKNRRKAASVMILGTLFGILLGDTLAGWLVPDHHGLIASHFETNNFSAYLVFGIIGGTIGSLYFGSKWRLTEQSHRIEQAQRAAAEAELRVLQAQVEPHFLFNTLANLDALIALDPKQARVLLGHLNRYLRNSLNHSRSEATTLGDEIEQLRAYLGIMEIRLPDRLQTSIDCPPDCTELPLAPMLLQPLVENAIKHGIESSPRGGEIRVQARIAGETLEIEVRDSGIGLGKARRSETSNGTGIANIRERLQVLYGEEARLELAALPDAGTLALLRIPLASLDRKPI